MRLDIPPANLIFCLNLLTNVITGCIIVLVQRHKKGEKAYGMDI